MQKRVFSSRVVLTMTSLFLLSFLLTSLTSASDVAYLYSRSFKIDNNVINTFSELGLTTDKISETSLPLNLSKYRLIYIGDENFNNPSVIPIGKIPTIIANYYHGKTFGLTDNEGVSQLGSNAPLKVNENGKIIQVYTQATKPSNAIGIPYYFLGNNDKADSLFEIAGTYTGDPSLDLGDVISYANKGDVLYNGQTLNSRLCFFGIINSKYWTADAKQLFEDCTAFAIAPCKTDLDCNDNNVSTQDICRNPGTVNATCVNLPIACFSSSDCTPAGFINQPFCSGKNITRTFQSPICNFPGTPESSCSQLFTNKTIEQCSDFCSNGQCQTFACSSDADCNDNNSSTTDICQNANTTLAKCIHQPVACNSNSDCGSDGLINQPFCSGNNVTRTFQSFACNNPGASNAFCSNSTIPEIINQCSQGCSDGVCISFTCNSNADCNDNNSSTFDECLNPGTPQSSCRHTPVNCNTDSDCGFTGFLGQEFCSGNNAVKNFQNATCQNQGTLNSFCKVDVKPLITNQCQFTCVQNGICARCNTNSDCNDNNASTQDICNLPGTPQSSCQNIPIQNNQTNQSSPIVLTIKSPLSITYNTSSILVDISSVNATNVWYSINNGPNITYSLPTFVNFSNGTNTLFAFASNNLGNFATAFVNFAVSLPSNQTNQTIRCYTDVECGGVYPFGNPFCSGNSVVRIFVANNCINPGTPQSYCSSSNNTITLETCSFQCSDGVCINQTQNIVCSSDSQCNDSNPLTFDQCINPGTVASSCRNTLVNCASDLDCGFTGFFGENSCSLNQVFKNFQNATCNNPGTLNSFCNLQVSQNMIYQCQFACTASGACIRCNLDSECNDNNPNTIDTCKNPGTLESSCSNIFSLTGGRLGDSGGI